MLLPFIGIVYCIYFMKWVCAHCLNQTASIYAYLPLEEKKHYLTEISGDIVKKTDCLQRNLPIQKGMPLCF